MFDTTDQAHVFVGDNPPTDLAHDLHTAWIRFATAGDPNGNGLPAWPTYDLERRAVMEFGAARTVIDDPHTAERQILEGLI